MDLINLITNPHPGIEDGQTECIKAQKYVRTKDMIEI